MVVAKPRLEEPSSRVFNTENNTACASFASSRLAKARKMGTPCCGRRLPAVLPPLLVAEASSATTILPVQTTTTYWFSTPFAFDAMVRAAANSRSALPDLVSRCVRFGSLHAAAGNGGIEDEIAWCRQFEASNSPTGTLLIVSFILLWLLGNPNLVSGSRASGIGGNSKLPMSTPFVSHSSASICDGSEPSNVEPLCSAKTEPSKVDLSLKSALLPWPEAASSAFASVAVAAAEDEVESPLST
mmetsp:Transcript_6229/g.15470  ORF Transcript_6229/g.15470 Transcript_6229/m.15470 type:complete len:243 (-) Transcript_6229:950-1678(-)